MPLQRAIGAKLIGDGIWSALIAPDDLKRLGKPSAALGGRTVLFVSDVRLDCETLLFETGGVVVLNAGESSEAIVIRLDLSAGSTTGEGQYAPGRGDAQFLAECAKLLPPGVAEVAEDLVGRLRREFPGYLYEHNARQWVNCPVRFFAITIQTRNQLLGIHVNGEPEDHAQSALDLTRDRPGHSRFRISQATDLEPALEIIRHSACLRVK